MRLNSIEISASLCNKTRRATRGSLPPTRLASRWTHKKVLHPVSRKGVNDDAATRHTLHTRVLASFPFDREHQSDRMLCERRLDIYLINMPIFPIIDRCRCLYRSIERWVAYRCTIPPASPGPSSSCERFAMESISRRWYRRYNRRRDVSLRARWRKKKKRKEMRNRDSIRRSKFHLATLCDLRILRTELLRMYNCKRGCDRSTIFFYIY